MPERLTQVVVLAEDRAQQRLVRRFLERSGINPGRIREAALPGGRGGAGEKFVRDRFPGEVAAWRRVAGRLNAALVAVIDADMRGAVETRDRLLQGLREHGAEPRAAGERIAVLVLKRNCETWVQCLICNTVDEDQDYKRVPVESSDFVKAGEALFQWSRPNAVVPEKCIDSIRRAFPELCRLA